MQLQSQQCKEDPDNRISSPMQTEIFAACRVSYRIYVIALA